MLLLNMVYLQVSYLATDLLFPEWKIWTQFLDEAADALTLDALAESHPIEVSKSPGHGVLQSAHDVGLLLFAYSLTYKSAS